MKFKRFAIGLGIFILTVVFIIFVNLAINPKPESSSCYQPIPLMEKSLQSPVWDGNWQNCQEIYQEQLKTYKERGFLIVTALSILAIIGGVLVRTVAPVSWGLILGGVITILYILIANFDEIGKPYRSIISGVALAVLIWLAYAKLGDKEQLAPAQDANKSIPESNEEKL